MDERVRARLAYRGFGTGLSLFLCLFAFLSWRKGGAAWQWELPVAALSALLAWLSPNAFGPIYRVWMPVALFLGRINTKILMGIIYYLILSPYALVLRAFGMRPLDMGTQERETYWKTKEPRDATISLRRQF